MARLVKSIRRSAAGQVVSQIDQQILPPRPTPLPPPPTVGEMARNFAGAIARWTQAGFPTVSREEYQMRAATCDRCEFWNPQARAGLGKCSAPGCGCSRMKVWLSTERCPLGKW